MINRKGASVPPCRTPARISKNSVLPPGVITWASVLVEYADGIHYLFWNSICLQSKALLKSTKVNIAGSCFPFIPCMSLRRVKICGSVDLPVRNPDGGIGR